MGPITAFVDPSPRHKPSLLRRFAAALGVLSPRHWCSLTGSPLPELREVGHEWRLGQP
jgi:hypothetical protein